MSKHEVSIKMIICEKNLLLLLIYNLKYILYKNKIFNNDFYPYFNYYKHNFDYP